MIVGAYSLHLYCDDPKHPNERATAVMGQAVWERYRSFQPGDYSGNNRTDAVKQAKARGWTFNFEEGKAFCPCCSKGQYLPATTTTKGAST